ncbi:lantibiotic dehydratase [Chryseobacterium glaciei]|uniref:Lantibiotic dehydratase n=1 Tax=Chryseobacterium glaciei TaxID=1685010 RepID=A0A172Y192_9FLAO|nr:thiopeptide-type bacteriocin biosynthesis protein [Chryseobacterium glaciei]ANF52984.1 lantibiotic dehydratase [Chryseobacterium glaciei]
MKTIRKFFPGSEWLYLKIYTGVKTSDIILEEIIQPLIENFQCEKYIQKWFFIRYNDPKSHVRIRFELSSIKNYNAVTDQINKALQGYLESGEISNIVFETYNREIERYGENTIEDTETLFHKNSEFTLQCLNYNDEEKLTVSLFYIDEVLNRLNLSVQEKMEWMRDYNASFKNEFNADKKLNSQLDKKFRAFKPIFLDFIGSQEFSDERNMISLHIEECSIVLQNILKLSKNQSLQNFIQSVFHMNINRLFISDQRLFEMIIYDYLYRYYKMKAFLK